MSDKILDPGMYVEPEPKYIETEIAVLAQDVRPGDLRNGREIASVKSGTKWTYLYDSQGKTIDEVKIGDVIPVIRREVSAEDAVSQYRARINRDIAEKLAGRNGPLRALQNKVNEDLEQRGGVDFATISRLIQVQAELKILNELAVAATRAGEDEDLVDVQRDFAEHLTHKLVRDTRQRILTRTGTCVQNLLEDADRDAMADFIERVRWAY